MTRLLPHLRPHVLYGAYAAYLSAFLGLCVYADRALSAALL